MYYNKTEITRSWGDWLSKKSWDFFSTITYKHNIKPKRNEQIMFDLEKSLQEKIKSFKMFWIMEHTSNGYQTHNHLLIEGDKVDKVVNQFLISKSLINKKYVRHIPYNKDLGATYYVSKYICSKSVHYGIIQSNSKL